MKKIITKTELRQNCFRSNGKIHVGFFVDDEPFFSIVSKDEIYDYLLRHPDKAEKYNKFFMSPETVAIDKFITEDIKILAPSLYLMCIEVYYKKQKIV